MIILRIIAFIFLFFSAIFFPWPVAVSLGIILMVVFSWFWETILIGLLLAIVYGSKNTGMANFYFFIVSFPLALFAVEFTKKIIEGENVISHAIVVLSGCATIFLLWCIFRLLLAYV